MLFRSVASSRPAIVESYAATTEPDLINTRQASGDINTDASTLAALLKDKIETREAQQCIER
jgi:hypothetical protein